MPSILSTGQYLGRMVAAGDWESGRVSETRYARGAFLRWHRHDEGYLTVVLRGGYVERVGGETRTCAVHALVIHPPGEEHQDEFRDHAATCLNVVFDSRLTARLGTIRSMLEESRVLTSKAAHAIAQRLRQELLHRRDEATGLVVEGLLLELAGTLSRATSGGESRLVPWLREAAAIVEQRFLQPITLARVAEEVGVHPVHLARCFRERFGASVGERVRALRLDHARELIASGKPLALVAAESGFADQSHFTRAFTRALGVPPAAYRRIAGSGCASGNVARGPKRSAR